MKILLLVIGIVIGGAAGWFTAPKAVDIDVGGLSVEVEGSGKGGAMISADRKDGLDVSIGRGSVFDDRNTRTAIFAAIGGLIGLIIGFVADRRRRV